ncbi:MAG TPA: gliding motility-associated C-terminal domain-containing protein [Bacteroidia bacterium]|nr:gliding motility-associated C-terminal domain-containing protein [Bacteroidia bacterium]
MKIILPALFIFCSVGAATLRAQTSFVRSYGIWNESFRNNFQQTSDGGYILSIDAVPEMDGNHQVDQGYLVKMDPQGNTQWIKNYDKSNIFIKSSDGTSVCQAPDGGYAIGTTSYYSYNSSMIYLIKTDVAGNPLWAKHYPGLGSSACFCIRPTADGGYVLCGNTKDTMNVWSNTFIYLLKTDGAGVPQWGMTYTETISGSGGTAYTVSETADGGYVLGGYSSSGGFILKTDGNGHVQWGLNSMQAGNDAINSIRQTSDGGYIGCGTLDGFSLSAALLIKLDPAGSVSWTKAMKVPSDMLDFGLSAREVTGGYALLCSTDNGVMLAQTDANGQLLWQHGTRGYPNGQMQVSYLETTTDGGFAFDYLFDQGAHGGVAVIKTDNSGMISCNANPDTLTEMSCSAPLPIAFTTVLADPFLNTPVSFTTKNLSESDCPLIHTETVTGDFSIPNVFTPNNDGINDYFLVNYDGGKDYRIRIYDRWGVLMFTSTDSALPWDGKARDGKEATDGTYYYIIELGEQEHYTGFLTLLR